MQQGFGTLARSGGEILKALPAGDPGPLKKLALRDTFMQSFLLEFSTTCEYRRICPGYSERDLPIPCQQIVKGHV
jgi:hypothetical protein